MYATRTLGLVYVPFPPSPCIHMKAGLLAGRVEDTLARDPDAPLPHVQQQLLQLESEVAAATAALHAAGPHTDAAAASGDNVAAASVAADTGNDSTEGRSGAGSGAAAAHGMEGAACVEAGSSCCEAVGEADGRGQVEELLPALATGRLARGADALLENSRDAVTADWRWEQLCDAMDRLLDWGGCLLDKKVCAAWVEAGAAAWVWASVLVPG